MKPILCGLLAGLVLYAGASSGGEPWDEQVERLIVRLRDGATALHDPAVVANRVRELGVRHGLVLRHLRTTGSGAQVLRLPRRMSRIEADEYVRRIAADPAVAAVEPDLRFHPLASPNDAHFGQQWALLGPGSEVAGLDAVGAWATSTGDAALVIAVLDTGILPHADLVGRTIPVAGEPFPYGYDFIHADASGEPATANDGDGRDPDPTDPGDWIEAADLSRPEFPDGVCEVRNSSWHGTHVAGILAAAVDNNLGVTGIDWQSRLLPVRVLGKCGGYLSDIVDAVYWSAGLEVPGVPANLHPAKVINMSLGAGSACGPFMQAAVDAAAAAGAVVVAAAGNEATDAAAVAPANCAGVIAVTALDRAGDRAYYANFGNVVDVAAPGGTAADAIYSTYDGGTRGPLHDSRYAALFGTSMATPHASGAIALMLSGHFALTGNWLAPALVEAKLRAGVRDFPGDSLCVTGGCGAGMVDAARAVAAVTTLPIVEAGPALTAAPGALIALDGSGSRDDGAIAVWRWQQTDTSGYAVPLSGSTTASASLMAPTDAPAGTVLEFRLDVTDDVGLTGSATVSVTLNAGIPVLAAPGDRTVTAGAVLVYPVNASQADGGVPRLSASGLPPGAVFTDAGDGSGLLTWTPEAADTGPHTITFVARNAGDSALSHSVAVVIRVQAPVAVAESGGGGGGAAGWGPLVALLAYRRRSRTNSRPPAAP